jgi:hypothetical protein
VKGKLVSTASVENTKYFKKILFPFVQVAWMATRSAHTVLAGKLTYLKRVACEKRRKVLTGFEDGLWIKLVHDRD